MNGYTCVVCVKQVPDTKKVTGQAMKADGTINRAALPAIFNPEDKNALEAALSVKERYGGKVIAIAMGLPAATAVLREALACGADEAVLVTDRKAAGSDTLATSYILSQAVKKFKPDLVFCGRQAIDGDTAQVGPQIGEKLDCAVVTYLEDLKLEGDVAVATRDIGTGIETCRAHLPALFTVTEKLGELQEKLTAKQVEMTLSDEAFNLLLDEGFTREYGAREMDRVIAQRLKPMLMREILFGSLKQGGSIIIGTRDGSLSIG